MSGMEEFFDSNVAEAFEAASAEGFSGGKKIDRPGNYRMKAVSKKFKTKDGDVLEFPYLEKSEKKKSLMLNLLLETVEDVEDIPTGSYVYYGLTLSPAKGASAKKVKDTMNFLKPRLSALIGKDKLSSLTFEWVKENLLAEFVKKDDDWVVKRDHAMQNEVMVKLVPDVYNNKPVLNVSSIAEATSEDSSVISGPSINTSATGLQDEAESDLAAIDALADGSGNLVEEDDVF